MTQIVISKKPLDRKIETISPIEASSNMEYQEIVDRILSNIDIAKKEIVKMRLK